jgi:hypothetical protein
MVDKKEIGDIVGATSGQQSMSYAEGLGNVGALKRFTTGDRKVLLTECNSLSVIPIINRSQLNIVNPLCFRA